MKDGTKTVIAIIVAFALLALGIFGLYKNLNKGFTSLMDFITSEAELKVHTEIDTRNIDSISINLISTDIEFKTTTDNTVKFDYYSNDDQVAFIDATNENITIEEDEFFDHCTGFCNLNRKLVISLPDNFTKKIIIVTTSGDISSAALIKDLDILTVSGDIRLKGITGYASITTTSGDINITSFHANYNSAIKTTSGDVSIDSCDNYVEAYTTSGDIEIGRNNTTTTILKISTTSGDIEVN